MRGSYNIDESEWNLIFDAPLTSDLVERVHNVTGVSNATTCTFDPDKGLHIKTTSVGQYGVLYTMPQSFLDAISTTGNIRLLTICTVTRVSGGDGSPVIWRMDNNNVPVFCSQMSILGYRASYLNLPNNVEITITEDDVCDYAPPNMTQIATVSTDYDSNTASRTVYNSNYTYYPQQCPYIRFFYAVNTANLAEIYIKNLKIYRHV